MNELIGLLLLFGLACVAAGWWLVRTYRRDRARERAALDEVLSDNVRAELDAERAVWDERRRAFDAALRSAQNELSDHNP